MNLPDRWAGAWRALGGAPPPGVLEALLAAYREPQRYYHTLQHLEECFAGFDDLSGLALHPAEVELALWFHDAIYDTRRRDNEERSAQWARELIAPLSAESAGRVCGLVMATRHEAVPQGIDAQIVVDVDLSILGAPAERFDEYELQVRREYAWLPLPVYQRERRTLLEAFLARPRLFNTMEFVSRYEERARANLARALARL